MKAVIENENITLLKKYVLLLKESYFSTKNLGNINSKWTWKKTSH